MIATVAAGPPAYTTRFCHAGRVQPPFVARNSSAGIMCPSSCAALASHTAPRAVQMQVHRAGSGFASMWSRAIVGTRSWLMIVSFERAPVEADDRAPKAKAARPGRVSDHRTADRSMLAFPTATQLLAARAGPA